MTLHRHWTLSILLLLQAACGGGNNVEQTAVDTSAALLVSEFYINTDDNELTITGQNFDNGDFATPQVRLNTTSLDILAQSADEITVTLPTADQLDNGFFLSVKTGDNPGNFDAYGLVAVNGVPSGSFDQLLVLDVQGLQLPDRVRLLILGYNFNNGTWPPTVTVNDIPLEVDTGNSNGEQLVLNISNDTIEAISKIPDEALLIVQSGPADIQYDVYGLSPSAFAEETMLACKRTDLKATPATGEHCCTTSGQDLCWKAGPLRTDIVFGDTNSIPTYFELTQDYVIPIAPYFADPPPVPFPTFDVYKDGDPATKREILSGWVQGLPIHFETTYPEVVKTRKWDFLRYDNGNLIIKKGYRWDGASVGEPNFFKFLKATKLVNMRASLVHDAFYDLLRLHVITWTTADLPPRKGGKNDYRNVADLMFYLTAKEDGQTKKLKPFFKTLRLLGYTKAKLDPEKNAAWRYHSFADARLTAEGAAVQVDEAGNKHFTLTCAKDTAELELDAGHSLPIAKMPQQGIHQGNLHETSWEWLIDGKLLRQGVHGYPTGDLINYPDTFKDRLSLAELTGLGVLPDVDYPLTLSIDMGKDTSVGNFQSEDMINFRVEVDTEPPVITGITEPLILWPPHHKYITITIEDLVSSVTDNCTTMSLDDLLITEVTSNEPDDHKGDGHTKEDIVIAPDGKSVRLRIERSGMGDGRVYTIYVQAVDESGNTSTEPFLVTVPHHNKKCNTGRK